MPKRLVRIDSIGFDRYKFCLVTRLLDMFRKNYYQTIVKISGEAEMARKYMRSSFNLDVQISLR